MGAKNAAESILYLWVLPAADLGIKITHLLSVLQPKGIVFMKGYLANGTTIKRSYTPIIVCTKYAVLRRNYLIKSSHILLLSFHNLLKQIDYI